VQQTQFEVVEENVMLEQRIFCQFLPPNFDQLESFIAPDLYCPVINDRFGVEFKKKRKRILQQAKRTWLEIHAHAYEIKILEYEHQYQQALNKFELQFSTNTNLVNGISLFESVKTDLIHRKNRIIRQIKLKMSFFRAKLLRHYQRSSFAKKTIGVSPEVTVDAIHNPLNTVELAQLSNGNKMFDAIDTCF
jgi:hypothetical protein